MFSRPTDRVGIIGIGGLGHMAVKFAAAYGCDVTAFTSSESKFDEAKALSKNVFLIDEFIATEIKAGKLDKNLFTKEERLIKLHGHCQQKALVGTAGTKRALELIPGLTIREVDSGCCGMAGSFGYDHYDISQVIGNRVLFPAVREHGQGVVVAPGFSCRPFTIRRIPISLLYC
jgi:Fe-S oxidoreductase